MTAQPGHKYTLEEYLEIDRKSEARLEYWNGDVFDMSGVSKAHARIEINLARHLGPRMTQRGCLLFPANLRIKVPGAPPYRYADLSGLCGEAQYEQIDGVDMLTNPSLIVEALSDSTEAYDRGDKFTHYKSIPSFGEYLLIAQHRPHISHFLRQGDDSWTHREYNDLETLVTLASLHCELGMREVYEDVSFAASINPLLRPI